MHLLAVGGWGSSWSMLLRDMLSKAPIPSTETMVWFGSVWERVVSVWTMASVPARVAKAYWCGWHAAWKVLANIVAPCNGKPNAVACRQRRCRGPCH